jgi:hypothetical protein
LAVAGVRSSFINIGASKINPSLFGSSRFSKVSFASLKFANYSQVDLSWRPND